MLLNYKMCSGKDEFFSKIFGKNFMFNFQLLFLFSAIFFNGFGDTIFGFVLPANVSTLFIFLALFFQIFMGIYRIPLFFIFMYGYIIIQTFIFNYNDDLFIKSISHFIGMVIFSLSIFNFISIYRNRILNIVQVYYRFCFFVSCLAIIQSIVFIVFGYTISLQNMLGGPLRPEMSPEIFGFFPRVSGVSSEPATFAIMIIPGMFLSLVVLLGYGKRFMLNNKIMAMVILIAFILSFSSVGLIGLIVSILTLVVSNASSLRLRFFVVFLAIFFIPSGYYLLSNTIIVSKLTNFVIMAKNPKDFQYTANDLSGFALVSNALIAKKSLLESNYLGTGLNTHENNYNESIYKIFDKREVIYELNKSDAGSLFIRVTSEFGLPGLIFFIVLIFRYKIISNRGDPIFGLINDMSFVFLICFSLRNGNYLSILFFLFLSLYIYSYISSKIAFMSCFDRVFLKMSYGRIDK